MSFVRSRESTGCLEAYGVALAAERFAHLCEGRRALVESDDQCAIQALQKARKVLGVKGFVAVKKGTALYKKAKEFC